MSNQIGLLPPQSRIEAISDLSRHPAIGGWKELACFVRPDLAEEPDKAGEWMHRALDEASRDVFHDHHMDRVIRKGIEVGCHVVMHWKCSMLGYQMPPPADGKSERMMLLEEDVRLAARRLEIQKKLEKVQSKEALAAVRAVSA